jgi:hypothetical protein
MCIALNYPGQTTMHNHRKYPRKNCSAVTFFATQNMTFEAIIQNISRQGVYVESLLALPVGQGITVAIPSPGKKDKEIKIEGKVVWTDEDGFGVEFQKLVSSDFGFGMSD